MPDLPENSVGIVKTQIIRVVEADAPITLQCGKSIGPVHVAYETYGELTPEKDNVILICHALSGDAHVAGYHSDRDKKPGWWDIMVGPGKPVDTNKYFVICSNVIGGCRGTTGPSSLNPATGKPYGLDFPVVTVRDFVEIQKLLLDKLGITQLLTVIGGSMGGMQVMQWAISYPEMVKSAVPVATTTRLSAQSIAFDAVGRNAVLADPNFAGGQYHDNPKGPDAGLGIARMIGHITYLSEESMHEKFGRELRHAESYSYDFDSEFAVETYLDYQGQIFTKRFDANSYLYITKAMDYFDLAREYGSLDRAFAGTNSRFLVISFSSDWLFTVKQSEEILNALAANGKDVSYSSIQSPYGHDAFLLEPEIMGALLSGFIDNTYLMTKNARDHKPGSSGTTELKGYDRAKRVRVDYQLIESLIEPESTVLDVGCGDGELLARLIHDKNVNGEGIELDQALVIDCVQRGLSVIQLDIERGLSHYTTDSFDYAILSQTVQTLKNPEKVMNELLRVAKKVIVSFPNFAHWQCRLQMLFKGIAPRTKQLPFQWYNSPNINFLSMSDFDEFCRKFDITIERKIPLAKTSLKPIKLAPNLMAAQAIYVTSKA